MTNWIDFRGKVVLISNARPIGAAIINALNPQAARCLVSCITIILLCLISSGCNIESMWTVPASPTERPSQLWSNDPRTAGWNGVEVQYYLLLNDEVDADVQSLDRLHHFQAHGIRWYEDDRGERRDDYARGEILALEFDSRVERYRWEYRPGNNWGILTVIPSAAP